jgi:signal transduction histidine kinase
MMPKRILVVSGDAVLCRAFRDDFEHSEEGLEVTEVTEFEAARELAREQPPAVIVLDEPILTRKQDGSGGVTSEDLEAAAAALAGSAPVVVLGRAEHQSELTTLIAAGAADFVARVGDFLPVAVGLAERRLRAYGADESTRTSYEPEDFGETLRHELNNPLTGILGNAELLLAEIRRRSDERLPGAAQQRLETIADLALRMRQTIRRLSHQWESRHDPVRWVIEH